MTASVQQPGSFGWLITDFVRRVPGVAHAVVVSADGLLLAGARGLPRYRAEQLSAVASDIEPSAAYAVRTQTHGDQRVRRRGGGEPTEDGGPPPLFIVVPRATLRMQEALTSTFSKGRGSVRNCVTA